VLARQGNRRAYGPDSRDATRLVGEIAAILSFGAGVLHISAAGDHEELPVMFAGFLLVAALQIALGALLLRRPPARLILAAAVLMTLSSIGIWLVSRTAGLPFVEDGHLEQVGFKDGITKLFEIATVPLLLLLLSKDLARVSLPSPRLGSQTRAAVGTACLALLVPALLLGEGAEHSHEQLAAHGAHDGSAVAHAGSSAHTDGAHAGAKHGAHADGATDHAHSGSATDGGHSDVHFASAPLVHEHRASSTPEDAPTHHSGDHGGDRHQGGKHQHRRGDKHRGGNHDHGHDHGGGEGESPEAEPAISVSYEPEPRICVGGALCVP
jgi:hypothetical protein